MRRAAAARGTALHPVGRAFKRFAPWALAALVLALLARQARHLDWPEVWQALQAQPRGPLLAAVALAALSHALFASYDLVGRHELRHGVPRRRTLRIASICYAFNLNFGSLVGALAMKIRLYQREGLATADIGRVIALSLATNWLGYALLGGAVLLASPPTLPAAWGAGPPLLRGVGAALLLLGGGYLALCAFATRREATVRGHRFRLPTARVAAVQAALSSANWALMAAIVWGLLGPRVDYPTTLAVLLCAAVAGVVTHVPAGLGVLEAVFVAALAGRLAPGPVIAALIAYRAAYYLLPLLPALAGYAALEWRHRRGAAPPATVAR